MMKLTASLPIATVVFTTLCLNLCQETDAHPIILELPPNKEVCLEINAPDDDQVHLVMTSFPGTIDEELENWFVHEFAELTRYDSQQFMRDISNMPSHISKKMSKTKTPNTGKPPAKVHITLGTGEEKVEPLKYFKAVILRDVATSMSDAGGIHSNDDWSPEYGEMSLCFSSTHASSEHDTAIFHYVQQSEYEKKLAKKHEVRKEHLTPLESQFDAVTTTVREVLAEMSHMQIREQRMKHTTDSTNTRIRYFSYISISILFGVTYLQITYLKGYFKKKKVL